MSAADFGRIPLLVEQEALRRLGLLVKAATLEAERLAKVKVVSGGSHKRGTPTPAVKGSTGPALITGNARRSVTSNINDLVGQVGVARSAPYVKYLEELGYHSLSEVPKELRSKIIPQLQAEFAQIPWPRYM